MEILKIKSFHVTGLFLYPLKTRIFFINPFLLYQDTSDIKWVDKEVFSDPILTSGNGNKNLVYLRYYFVDLTKRMTLMRKLFQLNRNTIRGNDLALTWLILLGDDPLEVVSNSILKLIIKY